MTLPPRCALILAILMQAACTPLATLPLSADIDLEVSSVYAGADRFDAMVRFVNKTTFPEVIQEVRAEQGVRFVEKFSATPLSGYDHHFGTQLAATGVTRAFTVYAGETKDTDDTSSGFALLPSAGPAVTRLTPDFNAAYQRRNRIQGALIRRSPVEGWWEIRWTPSRLSIVAASGRVSFEESRGTWVLTEAPVPP